MVISVFNSVLNIEFNSPERPFPQVGNFVIFLTFLRTFDVNQNLRGDICFNLKLLNQGSASKRIFRFLFARVLEGLVFFFRVRKRKFFCFLLFFSRAKNRLLFAKRKFFCFSFFSHR